MTAPSTTAGATPAGAAPAGRPARPSRRLAGLFCVALLGVLTALGVVVGALAGAPGVAAYAAVALVLVAVAAVKGRALTRPAPDARDGARTCTCCTASQTDPVQVV